MTFSAPSPQSEDEKFIARLQLEALLRLRFYLQDREKIIAAVSEVKQRELDLHNDEKEFGGKQREEDIAKRHPRQGIDGLKNLLGLTIANELNTRQRIILSSLVFAVTGDVELVHQKEMTLITIDAGEDVIKKLERAKNFKKQVEGVMVNLFIKKKAKIKAMFAKPGKFEILPQITNEINDQIDNLAKKYSFNVESIEVELQKKIKEERRLIAQLGIYSELAFIKNKLSEALDKLPSEYTKELNQKFKNKTTSDSSDLTEEDIIRNCKALLDYLKKIPTKEVNEINFDVLIQRINAYQKIVNNKELEAVKKGFQKLMPEPIDQPSIDFAESLKSQIEYDFTLALWYFLNNNNDPSIINEALAGRAPFNNNDNKNNNLIQRYDNGTETVSASNINRISADSLYKNHGVKKEITDQLKEDPRTRLIFEAIFCEAQTRSFLEKYQPKIMAEQESNPKISFVHCVKLAGEYYKNIIRQLPCLKLTSPTSYEAHPDLREFFKKLILVQAVKKIQADYDILARVERKDHLLKNKKNDLAPSNLLLVMASHEDAQFMIHILEHEFHKKRQESKSLLGFTHSDTEFIQKLNHHPDDHHYTRLLCLTLKNLYDIGVIPKNEEIYNLIEKLDIPQHAAYEDFRGYAKELKAKQPSLPPPLEPENLAE